MATWVNTTLCTLADIESEVADLQIPLQVGGTTGEKEVKVQAKITLAKRQLKTKLLVALQPRFASTSDYHTSVSGTGYSWTALDTMLDKISNPTVLLDVAVAFTMKAMLADSMLTFRANYDENATLIDAVIQRWDAECKARLSDAVALLQFDLDENGTVDDSERPAANTTFFRV
jgi:hypothetical protein